MNRILAHKFKAAERAELVMKVDVTARLRPSLRKQRISLTPD